MNERRMSKIAVAVAMCLMGLAITAIIFSNNPLYDGTGNRANIRVIHPPAEGSESAIIEYYGNEIPLSIPEFWAEEYRNIKNRPLNFTRHSSHTSTQQPNPALGITEEQEIKVTYVTYEISSWDGSPLVIEGDLYEPADLGDSESLPGVLVMHSFGSDKRQGRSTGRSIAARGGVCLSISLPSHGGSEGPPIMPDLVFNYTNASLEGRQPPLIFLGVRAGLAGLGVLDEHPNVDGSILGIVGTSWGGLHAQYVSGIEHAMNDDPRLKMTFVDIAGGDILTTRLGESTGILTAPFYSNPIHRSELVMDMIKDWDPMVYAAQIPKIFYNVGTNDEFLTFASARNTWAAIRANNPNGVLEVASIPGAHHGIRWRETAFRLALRDLWGDDILIPEIAIAPASPGDSLDQINLKIRVPPGADIAGIEEISVSYKNHHLGTLWNSISIPFDESQFEVGSDSKVFTISVPLPRPWINSKTDVFASLRLSGSVVLSSLPLSEKRTTYYTYLLPTAVVGLVFFVFWITWKERYNKIVRCTGRSNAIQGDIRTKFRWRNSILIATEAVVLLAFTLSWVGASANQQVFWLNPLILLKKELYTYMGPLAWTFFVMLGLYSFTVVLVLYFPRIAAITNFLVGAIMAVGVYIVKNYVLRLPDSALVESMELTIGIGVWIMLCASIIQLFTERFWTNWEQRAGNLFGR